MSDTDSLEYSSTSMSSSTTENIGSPNLRSENSRSSFDYHMSLLNLNDDESSFDEVQTTPFFTMPVLKATMEKAGVSNVITQYGLIAGITSSTKTWSKTDGLEKQDRRIFFNVSAPSSTFICGSQGSGKSHTLSCLLENCLIPSNVGKLHAPLGGLVFHYDSFTSDSGGSPCEAAYLSSSANIHVRVLCSPSNLSTMKCLYGKMNVDVEAFRIDQTDLNAERMLTMMAASSTDGFVPLYMHSIRKILRELRMEQQENNTAFNYMTFKTRIFNCALTPAQLSPLQLRMDILESFLPLSQTRPSMGQKQRPQEIKSGNDWETKPGSLTIVDLSCPFVSAESACALFSICLGIFLDQNMTTGRVIALDEAHKFMNDSSEATDLTNRLLEVIRLQRHLGARVIIATQEPTISPKLLDLCSATFVHRFTSPEWFKALSGHLAGAAASHATGGGNGISSRDKHSNSERDGTGGDIRQTTILDEIVELKLGQALFFSPSSMLTLQKDLLKGGVDGGDMVPRRMGNGYVKIRTRARISEDGGKSVLAHSVDE